MRTREALREKLPQGLRRAVSWARSRLSVDEVSLVRGRVTFRPDERVMVDVGAHHGESLEGFARDGWQIYAFEPDDRNRVVLQRRVGRYPNVRVDGRAVAAEVQTGARFFRSEISTGISSLSAFHSSHHEAGTVDITTLRDIVRTEEICAVGLLKIDTEGHDLEVLRGAPWDMLTPAVVICEFEDSKTAALGYTYEDMGTYLQERGYSVIVSEWYPVVEYGHSHKWRRFATFPADLEDKAAWGNLVAIRDRPTFLLLARRLGFQIG